MAELKDFIAEAIIQVSEGITDAIARLEVSGSKMKLNPIPNEPGLWSEYKGALSFDMAVTTSVGAGGGAKLKIAILELGADAKADRAAVNRVAFSIPVLFPGQTIEGAFGSRKPG
ncbi:trypco2 family protein [Kaistia defluvii]|uniref:Trypsin-co-occurring domain-containing protein n=1 Tax=Kaistia defluvii TaxID=410841 RepID=A0ABV2R5M0_9HYPH